jgi:hypothetical protein
VDGVDKSLAAANYFDGPLIKCAEAYTGPLCAQCADNYYQMNGQCYSCGSQGESVSQLLLAAAVLLGVVLSGSALMGVASSDTMCTRLTQFSELQTITVILLAGATTIPVSLRQQVTTVLVYANLSVASAASQ